MEAVPYGRKTQEQPAAAEIHVIRITGGLSCDGDSVPVTAASPPGIEDAVMAVIPGPRKVHFHNPVPAPGADVDLMAVEGGIVRLRLQGNPRAKSTVESATDDVSPDLNELLIDEPAPPSVLVPLPTLQGHSHGY